MWSPCSRYPVVLPALAYRYFAPVVGALRRWVGAARQVPWACGPQMRPLTASILAAPMALWNTSTKN